MVTGYWPPTNEMLRHFSQNTDLNPNGWQGENWRNLGFDVVSFFGTGNARALASGITKATLPTMTGMAISIVGLLTFTILNSKSQSIVSEL